MSIQKITYFLFVLLCSCSKGKQVIIPKLNGNFIKAYRTDLSGAVFFIGPGINQEKTEIIAECDCCASDLAFLNDSLFIYVERCLGGDTYIKGSYIAFGEHVFLHIDENIIVSEENPIELTYSYRAEQQQESFFVYNFLNTTGKQLLSYEDGTYSEFGLRSDRVHLNGFLEEFRKEKILRIFLEGE